jgi:glycosyltransferase involved in cell wall biosynthesis
MDIYELIEILKDKFSKRQFFVRVYFINDEIIIYNDVKIVLRYNINLFENIEQMVKNIIIDVKKEIENKYSIPNDMVSVIIPNYNNEIFLNNVISKILNSTYDNIEIIVVDDKSTDNSINIIKEYESDKIRILENKENFGTYYSRNRGILMSKGEYILIVDGDDYIDSTYIENMVNNLKNSDKKIWGYGVHFERVYLNSDLNVIERNKSISYNILFKRKLFNYLGFFQNSRFGADSEYIYRAQKYNYPIKFDHHNNNIQYHANSLKNKNLTRTINWNIRKEYIKNAKKDVNERNYIEMAYLD